MIDELQVDLAATVEGADAIGEAPNDTFQRVADAIGDVAVRSFGRPSSHRPQSPRLSEAWFCCAEPTCRQQGRASGTAELATQPGVSGEHPM